MDPRRDERPPDESPGSKPDRANEAANVAEAGPSVLVVEDDRTLGPLVVDYLSENGFRAALERRGDRALKRIIEEGPDVVVLDVMLPGADGFSVCRKVRPKYDGLIVMLTARGDEPDEVAGLELGADDYIAKPVRPRLLLARLRALLRRPSSLRGLPATSLRLAPASSQTSESREARVAGRMPLRVGDVCIDLDAREATARGRLLPLTTSELDLLQLLLARAGETVSRKTMHEILRGEEYAEFDRSIDLRVSRLRQKIAEATDGQEVIKTVRRVGYLYVKR